MVRFGDGHLEVTASGLIWAVPPVWKCDPVLDRVLAAAC